ncbi:MAG: prepilin peptidase [Bacillota bacterium]|nr:prepilin peptidase [Bacillota bacterium]
MPASDVILLILVAVCAVTDVRGGRIHNWATAPAAAAGLALGLALDGPGGLWLGLQGLLLGLGLLLIPYLGGHVGAGDVKLLGAIGALKGPAFVLYAGLWGAVAGGVLALAILAWRGSLAVSLRHVGLCLMYRNTGAVNLSGAGMPYALPIAAGVLVTYLVW